MIPCYVQNRRNAPRAGRRRIRTRGIRMATALSVLALLGFDSEAQAGKNPYDWALVRLDYARQERVEQLRALCDRMHALAVQASEDQLMVVSFDINLQFTEATKKGSVPTALAERVAQLRDDLNGYYIQNYFSFYDILFVNMQGQVFYTIRKEADLNENLLQGALAHSPLGRCLRDKPTSEIFVDFHEYGPSSEPAAFFVEPVRKGARQVGWIVLQCAINKVNTLFAWTEDLGQTGETFLANQEGLLLTESNFVGDSTILRKRLGDRNIAAKFADKRGRRTVTDYRGRTALTSFEVVEFLGTRWLVVAKVDTDEIITRQYAQHRRYYADQLLAHLRKIPMAPLRDACPSEARSTLRVDMDEFLKASNSERIETFGVSTCTGLLAAFPGKFAYLAHISPKDKVYGSNHTNLLGQLVKRIKSFDIYPCERHRVKFVVVAPHLDSVLSITDKLVEEGFLLSQISVMWNGQAASGAIQYEYQHDSLHVAWRPPDHPNDRGVHNMQDADNLGEIIQAVIDSQGAAIREAQHKNASTSPEGRCNNSGNATERRRPDTSTSRIDTGSTRDG